MTSDGRDPKAKYRTEIEGKVASWRLVGCRLEMLSVICMSAAFPELGERLLVH
jgi:hypothetical protein